MLICEQTTSFRSATPAYIREIGASAPRQTLVPKLDAALLTPLLDEAKTQLSEIEAWNKLLNNHVMARVRQSRGEAQAS
jgi:hypothetical protein